MQTPHKGIFKRLARLIRADFHLTARHLLDIKEKEGFWVWLLGLANIPKSWHWSASVIFASRIIYYNMNCQAGIQITFASGKDTEEFKCLNRDVWTKFKRNYGIMKENLVKFFQVAGDTWLKKKWRPTTNTWKLHLHTTDCYVTGCNQSSMNVLDKSSRSRWPKILSKND